jgi:hypothetical protein
MIKKFFKKIKKHFLEVMRLKDSPKSIALGFAIGTAIALLPTFGLGALIGLGVILIFKKISKIALFSSFIVWNPAVLFFSYTISYKIGSFILADAPLKYYRLGLLNEFYLYSTKFLLGNIILVILASTISYLLVYFLSKRYQKQYKEYFIKPIEEGVKEGLEEIKEVSEKI